jgi:hypothetical protein
VYEIRIDRLLVAVEGHTNYGMFLVLGLMNLSYNRFLDEFSVPHPLFDIKGFSGGCCYQGDQFCTEQNFGLLNPIEKWQPIKIAIPFDDSTIRQANARLNCTITRINCQQSTVNSPHDGLCNLKAQQLTSPMSSSVTFPRRKNVSSTIKEFYFQAIFMEKTASPNLLERSSDR